MRPGHADPAQLTTSRAGPCVSRALANAASAEALSATSQAAASPPMRSAIASAAASLRSTTVTRQPACANAVAVAAPSPDAPPVTIAACSFNSMGSPAGFRSNDCRAG